MKILMVTNTYLPHVGGVANSVATFTAYYRSLGHEVLVLAPVFKGIEQEEKGVIRVPAVQKFNGSDFSVKLPVSPWLMAQVEEFTPNIIHSHHPFLLGDTALRLATDLNVPVIFTHHTLYERYTHYVPGDSPYLKRIVVRLGTEYANLCDQVIAPSESIRELLLRRGVTVPVSVVPTGIDIARYQRGNSFTFRRELGIPDNAIVIGHVGRLAPEKNLEFLSFAVAEVLSEIAVAHFVVVGDGPTKGTIGSIFRERGLESRLHMVGVRTGADLVNAYAGFDIFAFASKTETQGLVLAEAMAAGNPVVALDASGVREVVRTGVNGILVERQNLEEFASALIELIQHEELPKFSEEARRTAEHFSIETCAERALQVYKECIRASRPPKESSGEVWETLQRRIEREWDLLAGRARAFGPGEELARHPLLNKFKRQWRRFRRRFSRASWVARRMEGGGVAPQIGVDEVSRPGLMLIQIDGLSREQFESALAKGRLPFLRKLVRQQGYELITHYSGLPSTTPAVQGELYYGEKGCVPAFAFVDRKSWKLRRLLEPEIAVEVENKLQERSRGLLEGGSSYCNIYTGEAMESHFSPASLGWGSLKFSLKRSEIFLGIAIYLPMILRIVILSVLELVIAIIDCIAGVIRGQNAFAELKFIPARIAISIVLRELITAGALIDLARGLPIIHLNFLGYDEQSHRRGPSSFFAHWSLKGIDRAISKIAKSAKLSDDPRYQLWVYSDHGQEAVTPYQQKFGKTFLQAVTEVLGEPVRLERNSQLGKTQGESSELYKALLLGGKPSEKILRSPPTSQWDGGFVSIGGMGPLGHIYFRRPREGSDLRIFAQRLISEAGVPMAAVRDENNGKLADLYTAKGHFKLPFQAAQVFGMTLPYIRELGVDLCSLLHHPDSGDIVCAGWDVGAQPLSFVSENGAHGGPGPNETSGFLCIPAVSRRLFGKQEYVRPLELRNAVRRALGRPVLYEEQTGQDKLDYSEAVYGKIRVMSYNIHSCLGVDGVRDVGRIVEIISHYDPDIVCLQEVDLRRRRSGNTDQTMELAEALNMHATFHPAVKQGPEEYGDAILSRFPLDVQRQSKIASHPGRRMTEPRGAQWVSVKAGVETIHILNTHFGLSQWERIQQVREMLGDKWLGNHRCSSRVILCGDINSSPNSKVYKLLASRLIDADAANGHRPRATWPAQYPIRRIDYIFVSPDIQVKKAIVPRDHLTTFASDHLPVIADIIL